MYRLHGTIRRLTLQFLLDHTGGLWFLEFQECLYTGHESAQQTTSVRCSVMSKSGHNCVSYVELSSRIDAGVATLPSTFADKRCTASPKHQGRSRIRLRLRPPQRSGPGLVRSGRSVQNLRVPQVSGCVSPRAGPDGIFLAPSCQRISGSPRASLEPGRRTGWNFHTRRCMPERHGRNAAHSRTEVVSPKTTRQPAGRYHGETELDTRKSSFVSVPMALLLCSGEKSKPRFRAVTTMRTRREPKTANVSGRESRGKYAEYLRGLAAQNERFRLGPESGEEPTYLPRRSVVASGYRYYCCKQ